MSLTIILPQFFFYLFIPLEYLRPLETLRAYVIFTSPHVYLYALPVFKIFSKKPQVFFKKLLIRQKFDTVSIEFQ